MLFLLTTAQTLNGLFLTEGIIMGLNRSFAMRRSLLVGSNYVNIDVSAYSDIKVQSAPYTNIDESAYSDTGVQSAPYTNIDIDMFDDPPPP